MNCKDSMCRNASFHDDGEGYPQNIRCKACGEWHDEGETVECPCPERFDPNPGCKLKDALDEEDIRDILEMLLKAKEAASVTKADADSLRKSLAEQNAEVERLKKSLNEIIAFNVDFNVPWKGIPDLKAIASVALRKPDPRFQSKNGNKTFRIGDIVMEWQHP